MRIPRIFTDQPLAEGLEVALDQNAARHLVSALRFGPGDQIILFNGEGGEYHARLVGAAAKKVSALVGLFSSGLAPSPLSITLAVGLSRGERMDWVIQKAAELGVSNILPLFTARSEVKLNAQRAAKKTRHWQEITRSACEQSGQNRIPLVSLPMTFTQALQTPAAWRCTLDPTGKTDLLSNLINHDGSPPGSALVLSGPEGGFSSAEICLAQDQGINPVGLGPRILRTETAPIVALSILQARWGDWC